MAAGACPALTPTTSLMGHPQRPLCRAVGRARRGASGEEWPLRGKSDAARKAVATKTGLSQLLQCHRFGQGGSRFEAKLGQRLRWPPAGIPPRGFRNNEQAP
jgi:hypothetical protein